MEGSALGAVLATVVFGLFQLCGISVSRLVLPRESAGIRLLLGSVWGSVMLQWFPVLFAFFLDFSQAALGCGLALALLLGAAALWGSRRLNRPSFDLAGAAAAFSRRKFLWAVGAVWLFFCYLVWHSFRWADGVVYSSQATYGDMSMHLSFITSLANQGEFPPDYSLLPGTRLSYPFLSDSISASLYQLGAPLWFSYQLPMWAAGAQVLFGVYAFCSRMTAGRGRAALAWWLFVLNGGFGFLYFLGSWDNFTRIFTAFYETPTNLVGENIRWVNILVDMMLPQRATLFGWAVLFPALTLLHRAVFDGERRYYLLAGLMAGALPMIHTHSFLVLGLVCGVWLLFFLCRGLSGEVLAARVGKILILLGLPVMAILKEVFRGREDSSGFLWAAGGILAVFLLLVVFLAAVACRRQEWRSLLPWGVLLAAALVPAVPQLLYWTFQQAGEGGFVRGHFGWVIGEDSYLLFYLKNLGLTALLALVGLLLAKEREFAQYAPALAIWLLAELVEFQPNDYDNNKLLYPAFAFLCCAAAQCAWRGLTLLRSRSARAGAAAGVLALTSVSAVLTMGREAVASYELFGSGALTLSHWVEENTAADALFLTDQRHNNEVASLTGRNVVCGSPSYLYYHGLSFVGNQQAAQAIYQQPRGSQKLVEALGVDYILVSDFERNSYQVDQQTLDALYPRVYDDGSRIVYQVKEDDHG
ncbi:MAG: hypothetical protein ACOYJZ_06295 [Acutalibacter sp.]|jgi:hypothetical protein